jgi:outer membrane protein OmpA-like peptidoglycan-associated protein
MTQRILTFSRPVPFIDPARLILFGLIPALLSLAGCGHPRDLVVLLQDPEGKTGVVTVTTGAGAQSLTESGAASGASGVGEAPRTPYRVESGEIDTIFGAAIKARPELPASFTLYFRLDSSELTTAARLEIAKIVAEVRRRSVSEISIFGHADRTGTDAVNLRISEQRARIVRDMLDAAGLKGTTYIVQYFGDRDPLIPTAPGVAEPRNRRVEVIVR